MPLLEVRDLKVYYRGGKGISRAVDGVSFSLDQGEYLGLVGESGCGKTTVAKAILRLLPGNAVVPEGKVLFRGRDLLTMERRELQQIRWTEISTIPQSAMNTLDPVCRVGDQMVEVMRFHRRMTVREAMDRAGDLFEKVGLDRRQLRDYPHQFSSGMRQRAAIANALTLDPILIVADEPTTGLDVIVQDEILELIGDLQRSLGKAMLLITHNMSVVVENCRRVVVMYAGKVMEHGDTAEVLQRPFNPYTLGLQNAFPRLYGEADALIAIPGSPPDLVDPPAGCRFHERCPFSTALCAGEEPPLQEVGSGHHSACHYPKRVDEFRAVARDPKTWKRRVPGEGTLLPHGQGRA